MPWTAEQKIFIFEAYFRQKSIHAAQLQFKEQFWCREFPVHSMIYRWVNKFRTPHPLSTVCKGHYTVKCTVWVAISKHGIIGPFWFMDNNERSVTINTKRYVQVLGKFWTALGRQRRSSGSSSGSSRMVPTPTPQTNHWHGYSSVSLTDWSAAGVTCSGRHIHRTWNPQIFICGDTMRTGCMATTPRLSLNLRQQ